MLDVDTQSWTFTTAKASDAILTPGSGKYVAITYVNCMCSNSNTGDVSIRLGFAVTTLPAVVNDSLTGLVGMFYEHDGIAKGGGKESGNGAGIIARGEIDEPIRCTCSAATGGSLKIVVTYVEINPNV